MSKILVTGATGQQGGAVVARLLADGHTVHALTRDTDSPAARRLAERGAHVVAGDQADPGAVRAAVSGVDGVFSVQPVANFSAAADFDEVAVGESLIDAAKDAGVGHFVYTSAIGVDKDTGIVHMAGKLRIERHLAESGLSHTVLRPASFMENYLHPLFGLRGGGALTSAALPHIALHLIAVDDIADVAGAAFADPARHDGRTIELAGDVLTSPQVAAELSRGLGREVPFQQIPIEELRAANAEAARGYEALNAGASTVVDIAALRAEFPRLRTLRAWLDEGAAAKLAAVLDSGRQ
ncbi:NmrA/HSCARG family protein [Phytomonospora sp. NPDC050363]|uniref:NmrA/HSCARG family protein n=1 Tax=Phytomonospora sp. NPDC050363 TaxID=3155642 RepID=UPI0033CA7CDD